MDFNGRQEKAYLLELHTRTRGDIDAQVSMYEIGEALGLEKDPAGRMAEALFIQGYAELKTLSGGIGITIQGLEALDMKPESGPESSELSLGKGRVLEERGRESLNRILTDLKEGISGSTSSYAGLEEMVMDLKTIEVQLLSPSPKTSIVREVLKSILENCKGIGEKGLEARLTAMISS
ncbi:hypothetical protein [Desulfospira joergensenii]|uniref:hypothetical protein n=1 Tax=Desulfospira joergensenii TaxID=53329 RepID=UPI0003B620A4|nr:hypothetical protein [Desulfospira joergensenii]